MLFDTVDAFTCPIEGCPRTFKSWNNWTTHLQKQHGDSNLANDMTPPSDGKTSPLANDMDPPPDHETPPLANPKMPPDPKMPPNLKTPPLADLSDLDLDSDSDLDSGEDGDGGHHNNFGQDGRSLQLTLHGSAPADAQFTKSLVETNDTHEGDVMDDTLGTTFQDMLRISPQFVEY